MWRDVKQHSPKRNRTESSDDVEIDRFLNLRWREKYESLWEKEFLEDIDEFAHNKEETDPKIMRKIADVVDKASYSK